MATLRLFLRDRRTLILCSVMSVFVLFLWLAPFRFAGVAEPIFLHSTIHFGVDFIGRWPWLFALAGVGAAIAIVHLLVALSTFVRDRATAHFLLSAAVCELLLLDVAVGYILYLNA